MNCINSIPAENTFQGRFRNKLHIRVERMKKYGSRIQDYGGTRARKREKNSEVRKHGFYTVAR